jgi:uncharacterized protein (DUF952 family)
MFASDTATNTTFPPYVYKILSEEPPNPLPHTLPLTPLDKQDGFIHLSAGWRVPLTATEFFGSYTTLWVLRVDTNVARAEEAQFKWGDTSGCVHMYAREEGTWARMGEGVVIGVRKYEKEDGGSWEKELGKKDGWLSR